MAMFPPEVIQQEKRHERISAIITAILMAILFLLMYFAIYTRARDIKIEEDEYEVAGVIDFGDYREGSQSINNFQPATRNATPEPEVQPAQPTPTPPAPTPQPTQNVPAPSNIPTPSNVVTTPDPSPVNVPPPTPAPSPQPTPPSNPAPAPPTPQPTETNTTSNQPAPTPAPPEESEFKFQSSGGSNDGKNGDVGNQGQDQTKVLNPGGADGFQNSGDGGLNGRGIKYIGTGKYGSQQEGVVTFEITIAPDGSVANVRAVPPIPPNSSDMVRFGKSNIRRWRFDAAPTAGYQKVKYTMTFKLR